MRVVATRNLVGETIVSRNRDPAQSLKLHRASNLAFVLESKRPSSFEYGEADPAFVLVRGERPFLPFFQLLILGVLGLVGDEAEAFKPKLRTAELNPRCSPHRHLPF